MARVEFIPPGVFLGIFCKISTPGLPSNDNGGRRKPTSTMGRERISEEGIPVLIVVIIGIVLLMLNMCACGAVIYQKRRVRQREDNLRRQIKRNQNSGIIPSSNTDEDQPGGFCVARNENSNGVCNNDSG